MKQNYARENEIFSIFKAKSCCCVKRPEQLVTHFISSCLIIVVLLKYMLLILSRIKKSCKHYELTKNIVSNFGIFLFSEQ